MPKYKCTVSDPNGKITKGIFSSSSEDELKKDFRRQGLFAVEISSAESSHSNTYNNQIIMDFTASLAIMLKSGLSIKNSLLMIKGSFQKKKAEFLSTSVAEDINRGLSFYDSLKNNCKNLPPIYLGLVKIGERIGNMDEILQYLNAYLEDNKSFRDKIIGALIYPAFVLFIVFIVTILSAIFVVPQIQSLIGQFGSNSVEIEKVLYQIEHFRAIILWSSPLLLFSIFLSVLLRKINHSVRRFMDLIVLHLPLIKRNVIENISYQVLYSLEILTSSGIPLEEALTQIKDVTQNEEVKIEIENIRHRILKGDKLSSAFSKSRYFPKRIGQWLEFGESTGNIQEILKQLKLFYKSSIEKRLKIFMTMVEPAMIMMVGVVLLIFIFNIVVPLLTIYSTVL